MLDLAIRILINIGNSKIENHIKNLHSSFTIIHISDILVSAYLCT
jgi:hypothetical protein